MEAAAKGDRSFAAKLYSQLDAGDGNLFFSPTSIRMALAMTYAGARGDTAREMADVLSLDGDRAAVDEGFAALLEAYGQQPGADAGRQTLRVVNRLWGERRFAFLPAYETELSTYYGAPLTPVDFVHDAQGSRSTINRFIEDQTEHKIVDLLPPDFVDSSTRLVLTNAVYFKAAWAAPFSEGATQDGDFLGPRGAVHARLMHAQENLRFGETSDAQVLEMPYASGQSSLVVVLPKQRDGLAKLEATLSDASFAAWTSALQPETVNVTMPRFTTSATIDLGGTLQRMGMGRAFDCGSADFSGMDGARDLCVSGVVHKAWVAVDEKGTEAAAATAVGVKASAIAVPVRVVEFRADHPFLFFVRDARTGTPLFLGRIVDPTR